jgi:hypothetical protein
MNVSFCFFVHHVIFHSLCNLPPTFWIYCANLPKKLHVSHNLIVSENCKFRREIQLLRGRDQQVINVLCNHKMVMLLKALPFPWQHIHFLRFVGNTAISLAILVQHICPWKKSYLDTKWPFLKATYPKAKQPIHNTTISQGNNWTPFCKTCPKESTHKFAWLMFNPNPKDIMMINQTREKDKNTFNLGHIKWVS